MTQECIHGGGFPGLQCTTWYIFMGLLNPDHLNLEVETVLELHRDMHLVSAPAIQLNVLEIV